MLLPAPFRAHKHPHFIDEDPVDRPVSHILARDTRIEHRAKPKRPQPNNAGSSKFMVFLCSYPNTHSRTHFTPACQWSTSHPTYTSLTPWTFMVCVCVWLWVVCVLPVTSLVIASSILKSGKGKKEGGGGVQHVKLSKSHLIWVKMEPLGKIRSGRVVWVNHLCQRRKGAKLANARKETAIQGIQGQTMTMTHWCAMPERDYLHNGSNFSQNFNVVWLCVTFCDFVRLYGCAKPLNLFKNYTKKLFLSSACQSIR